MYRQYEGIYIMNQQYGWFSFADGFVFPEQKTLAELASKGGDHLLHVVNVLLNSGSEEAESLAEALFDAHA
jgi:hypothetical protein